MPEGFTADWSGGTISPGQRQEVWLTLQPGAAATSGGTVTVQSNKTTGTNTLAADYSEVVREPGFVLMGMGKNDSGQLGSGPGASQPTPRELAQDVAQIAAGDSHSLFLKADGSLWATGNNSYGQLGNGSTSSRNTSVQVATDVAHISAGTNHSLFIKTDGSLWAMGWNTYGQLGDGTTTNRSTPVQITTGVAQISAGNSHSLFVKTGGSLWAMGRNADGQLGDGTTTSRNTPVQVAAVSAGGSHSLFLFVQSMSPLSFTLSPSEAKWSVSNGEDWYGSGRTVYLAPGRYTVTFSDATGHLPPPDRSVEILAHQTYSLADYYFDNELVLMGVGGNTSGQLGDGTVFSRSAPVQIATGVTQISAGVYHSLFVKTNGSLWGMGTNANSRLGMGQAGTNYVTPV